MHKEQLKVLLLQTFPMHPAKRWNQVESVFSNPLKTSYLILGELSPHLSENEFSLANICVCWFCIHTCGRLSCHSCTSEPAASVMAQWCPLSDVGQGEGWNLRERHGYITINATLKHLTNSSFLPSWWNPPFWMLYSDRVSPSSSCFPAKSVRQ